MPSGADMDGAASDGTEEQVRPSDDRAHSPEQENPEQLKKPTPGPSNGDPLELTKTNSASKALSPIILPQETESRNPSENEGIDNLDNLVQGTKMEDIGPFATRLKFEETKSQFDQLGEVMKERAITTMMECLNMQLQQQQQGQRRRSGANIAHQEVQSKRSLSLRSNAISLRTLRSDASLNCISTASCKAKPTGKAAKMFELEKQVNNLEKQCRVLDRHLREHDRDQKGIQSKIHRLEMKILHEGQKRMIWDMMEKIPTDEDLKTIESFHTFALERKHTESQIKVLNIKVKALNAAMGKMTDPLSIDQKPSLSEMSNSKQAMTREAITRALPDFTSMTPEEREEFFRRAGVTLYEYDRDLPEPDDSRQTKQKGKKSKLKKTAFLEDEGDSSPPPPIKVVAVAKRKSRGIAEDGNENNTKAKAAKKTSKLAAETPSITTIQSVQFPVESGQPADNNGKTSDTTSLPVEDHKSSDSDIKEGSLSNSEEYSDFEDHVLLECPFAQTTKEGEGIQQLHIGLTPTKLILAKDYLEWKDDTTVKEDPLVGTLELVSMLPVEFVNLSVYRRKTRNTIKARFCNQQVLYFELAASFRREMFWNLWCERMKFLCPDEEHRQSDSSDSGSESTASSSSFRIQSYRGPKAWEERNLFLGTDYSYENLQINDWLAEPKNSEFDEPSQEIARENTRRNSGPEEYQRVYRFGSGIDENCGTSLYLPANPALVSRRTRESKMSDGTSDEESPPTSYQFLRLTEDAVRVWERNSYKPKVHKHSSGLTPFSNHLSGMGCIDVSRGMCTSLQMKRAASEVKLRDTPEEVRTAIPKRVLVSSVSCECLLDFKKEDMDAPLQRSWRLRRTSGTQLYWTPNVDRLTSSPVAYKTLRKHLGLLHDYRKSLGAKKKRSIWTRMKKLHPPKKDNLPMHHLPSWPRRSYNTLRKQLKMDITVSSWDFDSTILSYQLTLLDRDLLLMIAPSELQILLTEKSSRNASNIKVMIDFSDRISNLIVTEVIRLDSLKMRARLIGKYINVADKLHRLHNMHSTQSVLNGLTSPALYRLRNTWAYVRRHHYSKYKRLKTLIKLYKDVRTPLYCKMFEKFSRTPPYLPSIRCVIYGLLGFLPKARSLSGSKSYTSITTSVWGKRQRMNLWRTQSAGGSLVSETTKNSLSSESGDSHSETLFCRPYDWECGQSLRLEAAEKALKAWQNAALTYDLIESPLVREFLLKAKYLKEQESFFFSQNIEPNETPEEITLNKILNEMEDAK